MSAKNPPRESWLWLRNGLRKSIDLKTCSRWTARPDLPQADRVPTGDRWSIILGSRQLYRTANGEWAIEPAYHGPNRPCAGEEVLLQINEIEAACWFNEFWTDGSAKETSEQDGQPGIPKQLAGWLTKGLARRARYSTPPFRRPEPRARPAGQKSVPAGQTPTELDFFDRPLVAERSRTELRPLTDRSHEWPNTPPFVWFTRLDGLSRSKIEPRSCLVISEPADERPPGELLAYYLGETGQAVARRGWYKNPDAPWADEWIEVWEEVHTEHVMEAIRFVGDEKLEEAWRKFARTGSPFSQFADAKPPVGPPGDTPLWDPANPRELIFRKEPFKVCENRSESRFRILEAFHEADWMTKVDSPFEHELTADNVHNLRLALRKARCPVSFSSSEGGRKITWQLVGDDPPRSANPPHATPDATPQD